MRNNRFSSASDRRWQRRYERILERREAEADRRERCSPRVDIPEVRYDTISDQLSALAESVPEHITIGEMLHQMVDEQIRRGAVQPEQNREIFSAEALLSAMERLRPAEAETASTTTWVFEEADRPIRVVFAEPEPQFLSGMTATSCFYDESIITVKNGGYIFMYDTDSVPLEPGDDSAIDEFLGEFVAPGA